MAFALLTSASAGSPTLFGTVTTGAIDTTGADFLVAVIACNAGTGTMSDSKSNTWTGLTLSNVNIPCQIFYCIPSSVGAGHTFSWSGGAVASIAVASFSGAKQTSPADQQNGAGGTQPGSITPSQANTLVIAGASSGDSTPCTTVDSGFTVPEAVGFLGGKHFGVSLAYQIQTAATARNPNFSISSAGDAVIASFFVGAAPYVNRMLLAF